MLNFSPLGVTSSRHDGHDVSNQMEVVMRNEDIRTNDLIDLGAASVETKGQGAPIVLDGSQTKYPGPAGLTD
jgi:hypothetical protein